MISPAFALAAVAVFILLAVWVHLYWSHEAGPRYFFPIVILTMPLASRGLWHISFTLAQLSARRLPAAALPVFAVPATALVLVNMFIAFSGDNRSRAAAMELGRWMHNRYGLAAKLYGPDGLTQVAAHYAKAQCESFPATATVADVTSQINRWQPCVVLLSFDKPKTPHDRISAEVRELGFNEVDACKLPQECDRLQVLVGDKSSGVAIRQKDASSLRAVSRAKHGRAMRHNRRGSGRSVA
jgi:hypothetical protein